MNEYTKIDYLHEDTPIKGQEYICVSFLSPEEIKMDSPLNGFIFRGAFPTYELASAHAKKLYDEKETKKKYFHVYVGDGFKWLPWCPNPNDREKVSDQVYANEQLNDMMKAYKDQKDQHDKEEEERKEAMIRSANPDKKRKEALEQRKVNMRKRLSDKKAILNKLKTGEVKMNKEENQVILTEKKLEEKLEEKLVPIIKHEKIEKSTEVKNIKENLEKIKQLHMKMHSKK